MPGRFLPGSGQAGATPHCPPDRRPAGQFPHGQIGALKESGLLASRLPASLGAAAGDTPSTIGIIGEIAVGDPNVAQMLLIHYYGVELITNLTSQSQGLQRQLADRVLAGDFITNSFNEVGTKTIMEFRTRVTSDRDHGWRIDGKKFYATGSLAGGPHVRRDHDRRPEPQLRICWVDTDAPGVTIHDD